VRASQPVSESSLSRNEARISAIVEKAFEETFEPIEPVVERIEPALDFAGSMKLLILMNELLLTLDEPLHCFFNATLGAIFQQLRTLLVLLCKLSEAFRLALVLLGHALEHFSEVLKFWPRLRGRYREKSECRFTAI